MSWDINSYAQQAEAEIWDEIVANDPGPVETAPETPVAAATSTVEIVETDEEIVSFKRLRSGAWGLTGPAAYLREGEPVVVTKRDGERKTMRVGRVMWTDGEKSIATIAR